MTHSCRSDNAAAGAMVPATSPGNASMMVHGEPNRRLARIRRFDAMTPVRWDVEVVARREFPRRRLAFEQQHRRSAEHQHPLGPILVEPEARRAGLAMRDDALDAHGGRV